MCANVSRRRNIISNQMCNSNQIRNSSRRNNIRRRRQFPMLSNNNNDDSRQNFLIDSLEKLPPQTSDKPFVNEFFNGYSF
ncbi:hypothetical protein RCL_jg12520.t1 [Rhizophagus clarus]|uniref:Uncharacterized protein n=1 Tax=Rhizophagus clarus TaxID=94130 RepID=A0A8H3QUH0_9GLOM|nr:hypothetical protein RCL_jg12520.t1 [Rhizophagus clarus]